MRSSRDPWFQTGVQIVKPLRGWNRERYPVRRPSCPVLGRRGLSMQWYPLKLSCHVRAYAFGERLIPERLGKTGLPDGIVAETWEFSCHDETTATILNGEL